MDADDDPTSDSGRSTLYIGKGWNELVVEEREAQREHNNIHNDIMKVSYQNNCGHTVFMMARNHIVLFILILKQVLIITDDDRCTVYNYTVCMYPAAPMAISILSKK